MLKSVFKSLATASVLAFSVGAAHAVTVSYQVAGNPFGGNGNAGVTVDSKAGPDQTVSAGAGGFSLSGDIFGNGDENFVAWCLDIVRYLADDTEYEVTDTPFDEDSLTTVQVIDIGRLFNTARLGLDLASDAKSAGFQLALWEIIYETGAEFKLATGNLTVTGEGAAIAAGQAFLDNLGGNVTQSWSLVFLQSTTETGNQNLVTATPVPVPAAAGLLLLALGGLAAAGRRRRTT